MNISKEQMFELIRKQKNTTKEEVLKSLGKKMKRYTEEAEKEAAHPTTYYAILLLYLAAFYKKIEGAVLFDTLPDGWIYGFDYQYDEFSLNLEHVKEYNVDEDLEYRSMRLDAVYKLVTVNPDNFSVEQYAKAYDVGQGTVRQWIRRGKLRAAFKQGNEWKIPELSLPPTRGYEGAQYKWLNGIDNLPEEYQYLADYVIATFFQDRKDKSKYHVLLVSKETFTSDDPGDVAKTKNKELLLDAKDREKLELFLIAHPQVKYCGSMI